MGKAYTGVISQQGLLALVSEDAAISTVLREHLPQAAPRTAAACWAVLDDEAAAGVVRCLRLGEPQAALETLAGRAHHLGTWLPYPEAFAMKP